MLVAFVYNKKLHKLLKCFNTILLYIHRTAKELTDFPRSKYFFSHLPSVPYFTLWGTHYRSQQLAQCTDRSVPAKNKDFVTTAEDRDDVYVTKENIHVIHDFAVIVENNEDVSTTVGDDQNITLGSSMMFQNEVLRSTSVCPPSIGVV